MIGEKTVHGEGPAAGAVRARGVVRAAGEAADRAAGRAEPALRGAGARGAAAHHPALRRAGAAGAAALPRPLRAPRRRGDGAAAPAPARRQRHGGQPGRHRARLHQHQAPRLWRRRARRAPVRQRLQPRDGPPPRHPPPAQARACPRHRHRPAL